ncbi:hypothetical protein FRC01_009668 [Tulasnella sp. 417]|nr:hypothetical protein FRC01_009668 [Tulasnella sp. 417]
MTDFQFPGWMSTLNKRDRTKILKQCEKTVLCIPNETRAPLTERDVIVGLGIRRAVVFEDEPTGGYWIRGGDEEYDLFVQRLGDRGLPGFTAKEIDRNGEEWNRLAGKLADRIAPQDDVGPSQPQNSVEQHPDGPSTSHPAQLELADNFGSGSEETPTPSLGLSGSRSGSEPDSSRASSPGVLGGDGPGYASADPTASERPRKKARHDRQVAQQAVGSSSTSNSPTSNSPASNSPASDSPTSNSPTSNSPTSNSPTSNSPTSNSPTSNSPTSNSPTSNSPSAQPDALLDRALAILSPEVVSNIFELCLENVPTLEEYNVILGKLASCGGRCLQVLEGNASLWTRIASNSSDVHIKKALDLSKRRLLHIELGPTDSKGPAENVERMNRLLNFIRPHKDRWASLELRFPSNVLKKVKKHLGGRAPNLETLSLCMEDAVLRTGLAFPLGDALSGEVGLPLEILGGEAGSLRRVFFKNMPSFFNPCPFKLILELGLDNGIYIRYADLTSFLRHSPNLQTLHLANIKFVGGVAHIVAETILLSRLTKLVLAEEIEPLGLGGLYLSLTAPECNILRLDLRTPMGFIGNVGFAERVGPTVQRVLARNKTSSLLFGSHINTQSASWTCEDEERRGPNEHSFSFDISFRSRDVGLASVFSTFVKGFQTSVGGLGDVVVDVGHSASGAIANPLGLDLEAVVPTLSPDTFEGFRVVEVRADVVDGCLQHLKELMVPRESEGWSLGVLKTIRLYAIPKESETQLDESAGCCLEEFIRDVRHKRYGVPLHEPRPEKTDPMTFILEGTFAVQREMARALEKGTELWGIEVDHSNAFLVHPGDEEKKVEEKEGEKEGKKEGDKEED